MFSGHALLLRHSVCSLVLSLLASRCLAELHDPTTPQTAINAPVDAQSVVDSELVLSAIWLAPNSKRVIINGISAMQGDSILNNSVKILAIGRNVVIVNQNGVKKTLQLLHRPYQTR